MMIETDQKVTGTENESAAAEPGAAGVATADGEFSRSDLLMIRQAAERGWAIPPVMKQKLLDRLNAALQNERTSLRSLLSIGRLLAVLDEPTDAEPSPAPSVTVNIANIQPDPTDRDALAEAARVLRKLPSDCQSVGRITQRMDDK